ncbi:putative bifunctional diguanylate cyclase/phosphodiesterase [Methylobacterium radiodurans]|uniref:putative bifunctional diguanylate cyclase/phosphodiesterase n=1 Tax=Methylobacterium radiodurans TaxID=2202828 RepID=UPI001FECEFD2|nr:EAL domain-containing protein [Methylobacterium radiodurans]
MPGQRGPAFSNDDAMYRLLVQGVTDYAIYMLAPDGTVVNWNAGAARAKGYTADEIVGRNFACFYAPEDRAAGLPERGLATAHETGRFEAEGWRLRKDGTRFWAHVVIDAIRDGGALVGFAKITRDRTEQRAAAMMLKAASDNLDLALSNMTDGLCLLGADGRLLLANARLGEILGLEAGALEAGEPLVPILRRVLGGGAADLFARTHLRPASGTREPAISECVRDGSALSIRTRALEAGGWVSTFEDVSERRQIEGRLRHLARHDPLTGLTNRAALRTHLDERLRRAPAPERAARARSAVLRIDLDRFKAVNDTFGHALGDGVLREAAARLRACVRGGDLVARLGGDEFAVVVEARTTGALAGLAERVVRAVGEPYEIDGIPLALGASAGLAVAGEAGYTADALLGAADLALRQAKEAGRNGWRRYEPGMGDRAAARRGMERDLRQALCEGGFALHYQPIFRNRSGALVGFEALLRWNLPDGRTVSPTDFIPLAEEIGLMPEIGAWVLREACRTAAGWPDHLSVAVNVSPTQLRSAAFLGSVEAALARTGLPASRLELEITETAILENRDTARDLLGRLRALGTLLALDDFGTGYSSLSFVHSFPLSRIKIDRSFVRELSENPQSTAIVRAVVGLARGLGLAVTAEGVETEAQRRLLAEEADLDIQGFLTGRPMPAGHLAAFLDASGGRATAA